MRFLLLYSVLAMLPASATPFLVAHRGASADAPENTLPAFALAWEQGADAIEGDFHLTSDGHIVCIHDSDTKKVAKQKLIVKESTLEQLRALDVGRWKHKRYANTRIPTLSEVLATVPTGKKIFIEIKATELAIVSPLIADLRRAPLKREQVACISFHPDVIREIKRQAPDLTTNWLYSFSKKKLPAKDWPGILNTLRDIKADGLGSSNHPEISRDLVSALNKAGFQHHVWTVNDVATARRYFQLGTRSVTTDVPGKMRVGLGARPW